MVELVKLQKVEYKPEEVVKFIKECIDAKGLPVFRTRYAGKRFEVDGKPAVIASCFGGIKEKEPQTRVFYNVPEKDIMLMERFTGDWVYFLGKYAEDLLKQYFEEVAKQDWRRAIRLLNKAISYLSEEAKM
jgi:hypothetical protein